MKKYFADLYVTTECCPPTDVKTCENITVDVVAPDVDRAIALVREAVGPEVWRERRILDFEIEESGPAPGDRTEGVIGEPVREEMVRHEKHGLLQRFRQLLNRRTTASTVPSEGAPSDEE